MHLTVAVYLQDLAYGGPEEGGWYAPFTELAEDQAHFTQRFPKREQDAAERYAEELRERLLPVLNEGRPPISSTHSEGRYVVRVCKGEPVAVSAIPRYE